MKTINKCLLLFVITCSIWITQCSVPKKLSTKGLVVQQLHFFDSSENKYIHDERNFPDTRYWFRDSFIIQEVKALQPGVPDSNSVSKIENAVTLCYSFINMKTGYTYGFANLSDTAGLLHIHDIDEEANRPWGAATVAIWRHRPEKEPSTKIWKLLKDTIVEKILYNRMIWTNEENSNHSEILYARCDKKGTYFQFFNLVDKKYGCPYVVFEYIDRLPSGKQTGLKTLYEFGPEKLDAKMNRVFDAWERRIDTLPQMNIVYKSLSF